MSSAGDRVVSPSPNFRLLDLPVETQRQVIRHVQNVSYIFVTGVVIYGPAHLLNSQGSRKTLLALQMGSKHCHALASAQIYADLQFHMAHVDSPINFNNPGFRLVDALNTFATSDHDYAQYVRKFSASFAPRDDEIVHKMVASKYHFEDEPTRLLNTMLLLMLRKTKHMETFW